MFHLVQLVQSTLVSQLLFRLSFVRKIIRCNVASTPHFVPSFYLSASLFKESSHVFSDSISQLARIYTH